MKFTVNIKPSNSTLQVIYYFTYVYVYKFVWGMLKKRLTLNLLHLTLNFRMLFGLVDISLVKH